MKSLKQWKNRAYREATLPIIDIERGQVGNELKDVESGGKILGSPFKKRVESFKSKITELPTPEANKEGLGELGMQKVSDTTFGKDRLEPGRTPTISQGVPVQEQDLTEMALPRPIQFLVDRVLSMLGGNPYRAMALQQYVGDKLQGVLQGQGNAWARRGAMATKAAGAQALKGVGQTQPEMAGAMEAVAMRPPLANPSMGGPYDDFEDETLDAEPTQEPGQEEAPIPGPLDQVDSEFGRELVSDLRGGKGGKSLMLGKAELIQDIKAKIQSPAELARVQIALKRLFAMMGKEEESGE